MQLANSVITQYKEPEEKHSLIDSIIKDTEKIEKPKLPFKQEYQILFPPPDVNYLLQKKIAELEAKLAYAEKWIEDHETKNWRKPNLRQVNIMWQTDISVIETSSFEVEYVAEYTLSKAKEAYETAKRKHCDGSRCSIGCKCVPCTTVNCNYHSKMV